MKDTYNITVKCDTLEERDIVLEKVDELIPHGIVRYKTTEDGINNVFFSENEMQYFSEKMREVN
jgi:hypothetical protein